VVLPAYHLGFPVPHVLLATSTCVSAAINTWLLWRGLRKIGVYKPQAGWAALLTRILVANAAMAALLLWLAGDLADWLSAPAMDRALHLTGCILAAAAVYFAVLYLAGVRPQHMRSAGSA
jgi:putative peptidoglycan lipid II flippase